jgi:hypothetical protein
MSSSVEPPISPKKISSEEGGETGDSSVKSEEEERKVSVLAAEEEVKKKRPLKRSQILWLIRMEEQLKELVNYLPYVKRLSQREQDASFLS